MDAGRLIKPNAEHALKSPHDVSVLFKDDPAAVTRTLEVAERCKFSLDHLHYRYPSEKLPDGTTTIQQLQRLTINNCRFRYLRS